MVVFICNALMHLEESDKGNEDESIACRVEKLVADACDYLHEQIHSKSRFLAVMADSERVIKWSRKLLKKNGGVPLNSDAEEYRRVTSGEQYDREIQTDIDQWEQWLVAL